MMLERLHIENIAIIRSLDVDLSSGFSVFTGETGAGKSIIIDSIGLLLGSKGDRGLIRNGERSALVSGTFSHLSAAVRQFLLSAELVTEEDLLEEDTLVLQRTITLDGRSSIRCCGKPMTLSMLRTLGELLMSIHGQHDTSELLKKASHCALLDDYAQNGDILSEYRTLYREWCDLRAQKAEYEKQVADAERMRELLSYQLQDIDRGKLRSGEEEELLVERNQLQYAEKIDKNTSFTYRILKAAEKGSAVLLLERAAASLHALTSVLPEAEAIEQRLNDLLYEVDDIAEAVKVLGATDVADPTARLDEVETRLETIKKLERKYGATIDEVLSFRAKTAEALDRLENHGVYLEDLERKENVARTKLQDIASRLTERRRVAAEALKEKIEEALAFLDMPKVRFSVRILALSEFGSGGLDDVEFLLSANPGEPLAPLAKIASGGELSRIMLAFRSVFVEEDEISSMIFDEIDTGISGKTSQKVGIKLKQIAAGAQVICITHSPQIAALADAHFRIAKEEIDGRNETSLRLLNDEERVLEVARILGGIHVTDIQKQTARELIEDGKAF